MKFQAPRGTEDILPGRSEIWRWLEDAFRRACDTYDYAEIRTPTFEDLELFKRTSGETSDVVQKEMYDFKDKGDRELALKPEGTAPVVRAYIEHNLGGQGKIVKLFYIMSLFRYGRPQKGRLRELHQTGVELLGSAQPDADAEVIELTTRFYREIGLGDLLVGINSIGESECRAKYREAILDFAKSILADMEPGEREKCERNPLRMLDTKDEALRARLSDAPNIRDYLEDDSRAHFEQVLERLDALGVKYAIEPRLVRGLDYYTRTVFEVNSSELGAQSALCGGGRYDKLVEQIGGPPTPAVGVAMGIERALIVLETLGRLPKLEDTPDAFFVCLTDDRNRFAKIMQQARDAGCRVVSDLEFRSAKSQFRQADRSGATFAVTIGDEEIGTNEANVKNLLTGEETAVAINAIAEAILANKK
jgi:histidyl-tRNA synthetase